jgi:hypothetical protein
MDGDPMLNDDLSPVVHPYNWDLVRVPMRRIEDHFIVYVADGYHRRYDKDTLPDELKTKLTMILAIPHKRIDPDHELSMISIYTNNQSDELDEIGWRASESFYCIVMPIDSLKALRGETDG